MSTESPVTGLDRYVDERLRRPAPDGCSIVEGSTPVVAFGNPRHAKVATIGLNPSRIEFEKNGVELTGDKRRFETLTSLGVPDLCDAQAGVLERVLVRCNRYFEGNPYWQWFEALERVLEHLGRSYKDGSACHLDLCQWATDPVWGKLAVETQKRLVAADAAFLRSQLHNEGIELLLLNGRGVIDGLTRHLDADLQTTLTLPWTGGTTTFLVGTLEGVRTIAWSTNLQAAFGLTNAHRAVIASCVAVLANESTTSTPVDDGQAQELPIDLVQTPQEAERSPSYTRMEMGDLFDRSRLGVPPLPASLRSSIRKVDEWAYATRAIEPLQMYMFDTYLAEAIAHPVEDYFAVCHAGHGVNSYAVNYHLVLGPLLLFTQVLWGGIYGDEEADAECVRDQFRRCAHLIAVAEDFSQRYPEHQARLLVAESDFREKGICRWLSEPLGDEDVASRFLHGESVATGEPGNGQPRPDMRLGEWRGESSPVVAATHVLRAHL